MPVIEGIDTFPNFLHWWDKAYEQSINEQIESWSNEHLSCWPELLAKQIDDYAEQGLDWKKVAAEKVFPFLDERLTLMEEARNNLLELCPIIYSKAQQVLNIDTDILFVIHVGIGCGAGWATTFHSKPAILFGLENIAECGWSDISAIRGLISHELGHMIHYHWRAQNNKEIGTGAWWQLYEEGFAQYCETLINESHMWHQATADNNWLEWCQSHKSWLAAKFLKTVSDDESVNPFFGSWFTIEGKSETGYFLGYEVIKEVEKEYSLREIALLDDFEEHSKAILEQMKNGNL